MNTCLAAVRLSPGTSAQVADWSAFLEGGHFSPQPALSRLGGRSSPEVPGASVPGAAQTIAVCRLRTVLELGRPRITMACPTSHLLYSYFLDTALD